MIIAFETKRPTLLLDRLNQVQFRIANLRNAQAETVDLTEDDLTQDGEVYRITCAFPFHYIEKVVCADIWAATTETRVKRDHKSTYPLTPREHDAMFTFPVKVLRSDFELQGRLVYFAQDSAVLDRIDGVAYDQFNTYFYQISGMQEPTLERIVYVDFIFGSDGTLSNGNEMLFEGVCGYQSALLQHSQMTGDEK